MTDPVSLLYLAAHLLADFPLQTDAMASEKFDDSEVRMQHCTVHLLLYGLAGLLLGFGPILTTAIAVSIATLHFVIDSRRWVAPKDGFEDYPVWVDQSLHLASIALVLVLLL